MVLAVLNLLHVTLSSSSWLAALQSAKIDTKFRWFVHLQIDFNVNIKLK